MLNERLKLSRMKEKHEKMVRDPQCTCYLVITPPLLGPSGAVCEMTARHPAIDLSDGSNQEWPPLRYLVITPPGARAQDRAQG